MTKLEELKAAYNAAVGAAYAAAAYEAVEAVDAACDAYQDERKKTQEENTSD